MYSAVFLKFSCMSTGEAEAEVYGFLSTGYWGQQSIMGIINVYTGLHAYRKKTSRSIKLWTMIFTGEISFIAFLYLFQDKWDYIQKQGVVLGNEPVKPTTD